MEKFAKSKIEVIPILQNIRSIHNVGSIFRTANGAGCTEIILCGFTASPYDSFGKVRNDFQKTALGAESLFSIRYFARIGGAIKALKKEGFFVLGLEQDEDAILYTDFVKKFPKIKKIALVLGNEPEGIQKNIRKKLDGLIEIPMYGNKESLNVSVAFGIAIYTLKRT